MELFGPAVLRLAIAATFVAHGAQKLFGIWGGAGLTGTATYVSALGLAPALPLAVLVAVLEFGGGLLLAAGLLTRYVSVLLAAEMFVAAWAAHIAYGFFIDWDMVPGQGHGVEFHLVVIGGLICLTFTGAGALSVDEARAQSAAAYAAGRARLRGKL